MRVCCVVQARCNSTRLPGKVLLPLGGKPVIEHVLRAVLAASLVNDVILATTVNEADEPLARIAKKLGVRLFRGSEQDVLGRFVAALAQDDAGAVVRITADDPLLDPRVIDKVIQSYLEGQVDYASNILQRSWPRGMDTEVICREALERSNRDANLEEHREHVTIFVRTHADLFRLRNVTAPKDEVWPELRLCIDTREDYEMMQQIFLAFPFETQRPNINEIIRWLRAHAEVATINAGIVQKSVFGRQF
jgi:spore coat polysaccharide biosynthesis protein SpsF